MSGVQPPPCHVDSALFLDLDGTVLELAETPAQVRISARLLAALHALRRDLQGAVAIVSGRSIAAIDRLLQPMQLPIAGIHGAERRDATGRLHAVPATPALASARQSLAAFAARHPQLLLEDKGNALALHFRRAPELEPVARHAVAAALEPASDALQLQEGKMVFELKPRGANKGDAIADYMREPPFAGRIPTFVGDDLTDERGFDIVNDLGGHSIKVGDGASNARWRLSDVASVLDWLEACAARNQGE